MQGNGAARYNSGGVGGPMRHSDSPWARHNARPYDNMPIDQSPYDRARPYDIRADPQHYYDERRDSGYVLEYDASRYGHHSGGEPPEARHYRDVPSHARADAYGLSRYGNASRKKSFLLVFLCRSYDRHPAMPPADPYYSAGLPQGPPPMADPYQSYDPYQKYYASRPRDSEYPNQRFAINFCFFFKTKILLAFLVNTIPIQIIVMIPTE